MAARKYLRNNAGLITEEAAVTTSAGAADSGKIPALNSEGVLDASILNSKTFSVGAADAGKLPALDSTGKLDSSFLPVGIGADMAMVTASEDLAAGDFVNIHELSGAARCRKADASTAGKEAHGFVLEAVASGNPAAVYFEGSNTQVSGQVPGRVFLATTAGLATATAPSGSGNVVQRIGIAVSATVINFQYQVPVVLV